MMIKLAASLWLLCGLILMVWMMISESEPGALPLLMVITGAIACWRVRVFRRLD